MYERLIALGCIREYTRRDPRRYHDFGSSALLENARIAYKGRSRLRGIQGISW